MQLINRTAVIVGCGGLGSNLAHILARRSFEINYGIRNFGMDFVKEFVRDMRSVRDTHNVNRGLSPTPDYFGFFNRFILIDHDTVEPKNLGRQAFFASQVGVNKAEALAQSVNALFPEGGALASALDMEVQDPADVDFLTRLSSNVVERDRVGLEVPHFFLMTDSHDSKKLIAEVLDINRPQIPYLIANCDGKKWEVKNHLDSSEVHARKVPDMAPVDLATTHPNRYVALQNSPVNLMAAQRTAYWYFASQGFTSIPARFVETGDMSLPSPSVKLKFPGSAVNPPDSDDEDD